MAEVDFAIGHKSYTLTCQEGEERHLKRAAGLLDTEAQAILGQTGRIPEPRLLLLAGLMLADRASALEDRASAAERATVPALLKLALAQLGPSRTERTGV